MRLLKASDVRHLFRCVRCSSEADLTCSASSGTLSCPACRHDFSVESAIIRFVDERELSAEKLRELQGNTHDLSRDHILHLLNKDSWSRYYTWFMDLKFELLTDLLRREAIDTLVSLGSGTGFEVRKLLSRGLPLRTVLLSDLSHTALQIAPHNLQGFDVSVCLFTSDLDRVPVKDTDLPILVFEALHHTPDMHASLESMLAYGVRTIFLVEPLNNWVISLLARWGLARRIEYSGVKPGRMEYRRFRRMARRHGYRWTIRSLWEFPEDYLRKFAREGSVVESVFMALVWMLGLVGRPFKFGNMAVIALHRDGTRAGGPLSPGAPAREPARAGADDRAPQDPA